jgi:hypothetical protein
VFPATRRSRNRAREATIIPHISRTCVGRRHVFMINLRHGQHCCSPCSVITSDSYDRETGSVAAEVAATTTSSLSGCLSNSLVAKAALSGRNSIRTSVAVGMMFSITAPWAALWRGTNVGASVFVLSQLHACTEWHRGGCDFGCAWSCRPVTDSPSAPSLLRVFGMTHTLH